MLNHIQAVRKALLINVVDTGEFLVKTALLFTDFLTVNNIAAQLD
ncbi:MAG: hypothetical protein ACJAT8_002542 [Cellvibrionaceae bacterium]